MDQKQQLQEVLEEARIRVKEVNNLADLQQLKSVFLGKKGPIALITSSLRDMSIEEKKEIGMISNQIRVTLEEIFVNRKNKLEDDLINESLNNDKIDVTLPGYDFKKGSIHPLNKTIMELEDLFLGMGYEICEGPEIETDEYCFEKLNLPKGHPARDMQDTFYIDLENLLRSQTSPVQVRTMLERKGEPIKIICPGKVYRRDEDDATHSHQFMQLEGLVLGENITMADLKGALLQMARLMFGEDKEIRLRPSYFPFTEPSVEVDVSCTKCGGRGCNICKNTGFIEILGAGMVNNHVLEMSGYDKDKIQGFAFGVGIERVAMLKYNIDDIRNFYINDMRFLNQFKKI